MNVPALLRMVKIEHSVFALPFAYCGMVLAAGGWPGLRPLVLITVAMVAMRSFAMAVNRLADLRFDARNPRTRGRELVTGAVTVRQALAVALAWPLVFVAACAGLNRLCLLLPWWPWAWARRTLHQALNPAVPLRPGGRPWGWRGGGMAGRGAALHGDGLAAVLRGDLLGGGLRHPVRLPGRGLRPRRGAARAARRRGPAHGPGRVVDVPRETRPSSSGWPGPWPGWAGLVVVWALVSAILVFEHMLFRPDDMRRVNLAFLHAQRRGRVAVFAGVLLGLLL
jgi:4-hydroxybenzoate polyprenyltransferase